MMKLSYKISSKTDWHMNGVDQRMFNCSLYVNRGEARRLRKEDFFIPKGDNFVMFLDADVVRRINDKNED